MAFMDHIKQCNHSDFSSFIPFCLMGGKQIGWVHRENLNSLYSYGQDLLVRANKVILISDGFEERTQAMEKICRDLLGQGVLSNWRDENYRVASTFSAAPFFQIDRCAISFFGLKAYGVHINGFVRKSDGIHMWIARRAADRYVSPNKLDNMVAGGQPFELSIMENLIKECQEEAGVPEGLARTAISSGMITYLAEEKRGLKPDVMFIYDLEVPESFSPENTDGEVQGFELMPLAKVADIVRNTDDFKLNCNLVIIDFLIRHGFLTPDNTDDYEALVLGLRPKPPF